MAKITVAALCVALMAVAAAGRTLDVEAQGPKDRATQANDSLLDLAKAGTPGADGWYCHHYAYVEAPSPWCDDNVAAAKKLESQLQDASAVQAYAFKAACRKAGAGVILRYAFPPLNGLSSKENHDAYEAARRTTKLIDIIQASGLTPFDVTAIPAEGVCGSLPWVA